MGGLGKKKVVGCARVCSGSELGVRDWGSKVPWLGLWFIVPVLGSLGLGFLSPFSSSGLALDPFQYIPTGGLSELPPRNPCEGWAPVALESPMGCHPSLREHVERRSIDT